MRRGTTLDIVIPAGNPEKADIAFFRAIPSGKRDCVFRGPELKDIVPGDKVFLYANRAIHGWVAFDEYSSYQGKNLQKHDVSKPFALYFCGPMHSFTSALPTPPDLWFNRCRYVHKLPEGFRNALYARCAEIRR